MKQLQAELMDTEAMIVSLAQTIESEIVVCNVERHHRLARRN